MWPCRWSWHAVVPSPQLLPGVHTGGYVDKRTLEELWLLHPQGLPYTSIETLPVLQTRNNHLSDRCGSSDSWPLLLQHHWLGCMAQLLYI
ncbi:hypothetical protein HaLaN_26307 [Haematococcus lacustris]|uniref:Uncharacterized protein n=1 Tax=Haematococcus lacustris TaxID=44745 RepID=A0A6A0A5Y8_HAELA|nr:hypothetical protein HaLaN_26307 [Haematococcus lacustris]